MALISPLPSPKCCIWNKLSWNFDVVGRRYFTTFGAIFQLFVTLYSSLFYLLYSLHRLKLVIAVKNKSITQVRKTIEVEKTIKVVDQTVILPVLALSQSHLCGFLRVRLFIYYYARWQPYTYKTVIYTLHSYTKIKNIKHTEIIWRTSQVHRHGKWVPNQFSDWVVWQFRR